MITKADYLLHEYNKKIYNYQHVILYLLVILSFNLENHCNLLTD